MQKNCLKLSIHAHYCHAVYYFFLCIPHDSPCIVVRINHIYGLLFNFSIQGMNHFLPIILLMPVPNLAFSGAFQMFMHLLEKLFLQLLNHGWTTSNSSIPWVKVETSMFALNLVCIFICGDHLSFSFLHFCIQNLCIYKISTHFIFLN